MKKIVSLLLLGGICFLFINNLYDSDLKLRTLAMNQRDSASYVNKSVNGEMGLVKYGVSKNLEDGSANIVSSIVVNYRSFDTLGEVTVLFVASLGVAFLLGFDEKNKQHLSFISQPNFMLRVGSKMIFGFILLFGVYMMSHGHISPGGGFPGGSLIAASFLLLYMGDGDYRANIKNFKILESAMGTIYVLIGLSGLFFGLTFLENFIQTGLVGHLYSGGILPIIYVIIGLKVGSELIGVLDNFMNTSKGNQESGVVK